MPSPKPKRTMMTIKKICEPVTFTLVTENRIWAPFDGELVAHDPSDDTYLLRPNRDGPNHSFWIPANAVKEADDDDQEG